MKRRWFWGALAAWSIILTLLVYAPSLRLPFFFDDLLLLPYAADTPFAEIWGKTAVFPYYRPLPITFWRVNYLLFGRHVAPWLHGVNLLLHALNGFLSGALAVKIWGGGKQDGQQAAFAFAAATFFIIFPFHVQAVPWVTAGFHLFVTAFILGSLLAYWQFRERGGWQWAALGVTLALLALFTQENGVLAAPLALLLEAARGGSWRDARRWRSVALWWLPLLLWLPLWLAIPRTTGEFALNGAEAIGQNGAWFLQGMAFPVTWVGGWLRDYRGWDGLWTAVFLSLTALAALLWLTRRFWFAWTFALAGSLPALLLLPFAYLLSSPRLMTLTAVSAAWIWSALVVMGAYWFWQNRGRRPFAALTALGGTILVVMLTVVPAALFLRRQMRFHTWLGDAYTEMTALTEAANAEGRSAIAINFPYELGVHQPTFGIGHEGIVFSVSYVPVENIISTQTGKTADFYVLRYEDVRPQMDYLYGVLGAGESWPGLLAQAQRPQIFDTQYRDDAIGVLPAGQVDPVVAERPPLALFSGEGAADIVLRAGGVVPVDGLLCISTIWEIDSPPPYEITLFVHVVDEAGQLAAQADGHPWGRTYPMGQWSPGARIEDVRCLSVAEPNVTVRVGLYHVITGARLLAETAVGEPFPDDSVPLYERK
jgi:hypothetical protein